MLYKDNDGVGDELASSEGFKVFNDTFHVL